MVLKSQALKVKASQTIYANQDALDAMLRTDFLAFVEKVCETLNGDGTFKPNWHIELIVRLLMCTIKEPDKRMKRLALHLPPRHLKSIIISIAWPAWLLGRDPNLRIVCVSHTADLAADLHRKFRQVIESDWYRRLFPDTVTDVKKNTETEFETAEGGGRLSISIGASITGRGGDVILLDDPMKGEHAYNELEEEKVRKFFDQSLSTRLNNKKTGVIILTMQRLSTGDLAAHVADDPDWFCVSLPAVSEESVRYAFNGEEFYHRKKGEVLHPEHEDIPQFEELKRRLGSEGYLAQYQQAPVPRGGGMILWEWFGRYDQLPPRPEWEISMHSWDCAASVEAGADYSVWQHWVYAREHFYLVGMLRRKMRYPDLKRLCFEFIKRDDPDHVIIEYASTGLALADEVHDYYPVDMWQKRRAPKIKPKLAKEDRVAQISPYIEEGRVLLPRTAAFLPAFEAEVRAFPAGDHDDQVDAMSQALWYFKYAYENRTKDFWRPPSRNKRRQGR